MATISKANRPRRVAGQTRNGRPRLRALSIVQLEDLYTKSSSRKAKGKILNELSRQKARV